MTPPLCWMIELLVVAETILPATTQAEHSNCCSGGTKAPPYGSKTGTAFYVGRGHDPAAKAG